MADAYQCPKCGGYIIGDYCYLCNIDVRNYSVNDIPDFLKDILEKDNE